MSSKITQAIFFNDKKEIVHTKWLHKEEEIKALKEAKTFIIIEDEWLENEDSTDVMKKLREKAYGI